VRAVYANRYGAPEDLEIRELPSPEPRPGEVRVRVHAATVSRTDCGNLRGRPRIARLGTGLFRLKHPVLGLDFAGVVDEVGAGVTTFARGGRVFGMAPGGVGAHADYLCVPADGSIARVPARVRLAEAVVCEGVWYAKTYVDAFGLGPGHRIMVYGASGAIGIAAVQLAKSRGAEVTAVVDTKNLELARSLGADRVVDYTTEDYTRVDDSLDFVLDAVGKADYYQARRLLKPTGVASSSRCRRSRRQPSTPRPLCSRAASCARSWTAATPSRTSSRPTATSRRDRRRASWSSRWRRRMGRRAGLAHRPCRLARAPHRVERATFQR